MFDEQTEQYLVHSAVFPATDGQTTDGALARNTIQFLILSNEAVGRTTVDDDGDLDVNRPERLSLTLAHRNETSVSQCGYQLWNGALLLCDFLLTNQSRFLNRTILELGAGVGLCTLIASRFASRIISTDHDPDLLEVIHQNTERNDSVCRPECIEVQKFDWKQCDEHEIDNEIEIIIAADVVYDDDLTDALFDVFTKLLRAKSKLHSIYVTIEKRINFYTETRSIQCPACEYFLEKLSQLRVEHPSLIVEELNTDAQSIRQCTSIYQRTKELVLWYIHHTERSALL